MSSTRTQVYFTAEQRRRLDARSKREGKTLAELVREAVDAYVTDTNAELNGALESSFGAIPDFEVPPRSEWDG